MAFRGSSLFRGSTGGGRQWRPWRPWRQQRQKGEQVAPFGDQNQPATNETDRRQNNVERNKQRPVFLISLNYSSNQSRLHEHNKFASHRCRRFQNSIKQNNTQTPRASFAFTFTLIDCNLYCQFICVFQFTLDWPYSLRLNFLQASYGNTCRLSERAALTRSRAAPPRGRSWPAWSAAQPL